MTQWTLLNSNAPARAFDFLIKTWRTCTRHVAWIRKDAGSHWSYKQPTIDFMKKVALFIGHWLLHIEWLLKKPFLVVIQAFLEFHVSSAGVCRCLLGRLVWSVDQPIVSMRQCWESENSFLLYLNNSFLEWLFIEFWLVLFIVGFIILVIGAIVFFGGVDVIVFTCQIPKKSIEIKTPRQYNRSVQSFNNLSD